MTFNYDPAIVTAILGAFGIGLVYVVNLLKNLLKLQGKPAVLLVLIVSAVGTLAYLLIVTHGLTIPGFLIYTAAVFGTMTGWFKFTKAA